ncbi:DnaJ domain-containing protein [Arthrobacter roseus]|uniref:DnaJ domain-containing protein n=1 Tax=Arthrobacter roseus TaxID=136274 RepID=UPI0019625FFD|nr:hypothetical protein [Arthrobacter roseus]
MSQAESNPYSVLGVPADATIEQIRKAYRRKARATHPDQGGSAPEFHEVSEAYRLLTDGSLRQSFDDNSSNQSASQATPPRPGKTRATGHPSRPEPRRLNTTPTFLPPFDPNTPPVVSLAVAGQQSHSAPRRPNMLTRLSSTKLAKYDAEERTTQLLESTILKDYPAGRLINGARFENGTEAGSVLLGGYRVAVVASLIASAPAYRWDGGRLLHKGRAAGGPALRETVRTVQEQLPGCHVSGWLVLHNLKGNPFEPVIDYPPGADRSSLAPVHAVNVGTLARQLRQFMSAGPQPNVVQLSVLARLLEATT